MEACCIHEIEMNWFLTLFLHLFFKKLLEMVILSFLQIALASYLKSWHFTAEKCRVNVSSNGSTLFMALQGG